MCGGAGIEAPVTHFVHNGGMLHAVPDLSVGAAGSDEWPDVTCPICLAHRVPADEGHRFKITFQAAGSYIVTGDEHHHDVEDWDEPRTVEVRAWSLNQALEKAMSLPLRAWFPEEDEGDDGQ